MRLLPAFLLAPMLALPLPALDNSVVIHDADSAGGTHLAYVSRVFACGEIPDYPQPYVDGSPVTPWQSEVKVRCSDGSVRHALILFTHAITADGSITVDFRNSANPCSSGNQAACEAAGLDAAEILAFKSGTWGAMIDADFGSFSHTASARTMITNGDFEYWARGPVLTEVIARDQTSARAYDFGGTCTANCTGDLSTATWADGTANKSLHPEFVLSFWTGFDAVRIQYLLANYWTTHLQDQRYNLALYSGSSADTLEYSAPGVTHWAREYLRVGNLAHQIWDGAAPPSVNIDFNLSYLKYSGLVPNYDPGAATVESSISSEVSYFTSRESATFPFNCPVDVSGEKFCGSYVVNNMSTTGDKPERALFPRWQARWLMTMDKRLFNVTVDNGDAYGAWPHHYRESDNTRYFDAGHTIGALGKVVSINARPGAELASIGSSRQSSGDKVLPVATLAGNSTTGYYTSYFPDASEMAHRSSFEFLPYAMTGEWYALQLLLSDAAHIGMWDYHQHVYTADAGSTNLVLDQWRGSVWAFRNVGQALALTPDDWPEKTLIRKIFTDNAAGFEANYSSIGTSGDYHTPCSTSPFNQSTEVSPWCWARYGIFDNAGSNPLDINSVGGQESSEDIDTSITWGWTRAWQQSYYGVVIGHLHELFNGEELAALHHATGSFFVDRVIHPDSSMFDMQGYNNPVKMRSVVSLTADISTSTLSVPVDAIPAGLAGALPAGLTITDATEAAAPEYVIACSINGNTIELCTGTRGSWGNSAKSWVAGDHVYFERYIQTWADYCNALSSKCTNTEFSGDYWSASGYDHRALSALSFYYDETSVTGRTGLRAWDAVYQNFRRDVSLLADDPRWSIRPRPEIRNVRVHRDQTTATLRFDAPDGAACRYYVGESVPASTLDSGDTAVPAGIRERSIGLSGLSSGTTYHYRLTCGAARVAGTFQAQ